MATYKQISKYIKDNHYYTVKTCWIADVKNKHGLTTRKAYNRKSLKRIHPCPENKVKSIEDALRFYGMIE